MIPRATYRLQFHGDFTFADGEALVPYLARLGISHLYASPVTTARPGSRHGYDVIDPTRVNPELGGEDGLRSLADALHGHGMGLIVDIVPNHMAASPDNAWWMDVLQHGRDSRHARTFDIDWDNGDPELAGKVFLPILDRPRAEALAAGQHTARYGDAELPLDGGACLPAWWRTAGDRINWRRFFDINELVCLRIEEDDVFERVHELILRLVDEGIVDGLRVDHVDGLTDPAGYCRKLRRRIGPERYLVVEKILLRDESLADDWGCHGTTGYDFMDAVSALQHDATGERPLAGLWHTISGRPRDFDAEETAARREVIARGFGASLEACAASFRGLSAGNELGLPALRRVLVELLAHFPVYRTYGTNSDRRFVTQAAEAAKRTCPPGDRWAIDWLVAHIDEEPAATRLRQLSAPVAAKAVEDTAFYRYGRLLSRNDVGFDAHRFSLPAEAFHARMLRRRATFPHALLATATHDHKRGEDVRARLAVLSAVPVEWAARQRDWLDRLLPLRRESLPDAGDIAMLLQTIVGAWPLDGDRTGFAERIAAWQEKALREAKLRSDWSEPDERYEAAARALCEELLADGEVPGLLRDIETFVQSIAAAGAVNGLAQTLVKLTAPGVPDFYQGCELWDFSLVDPDNRRPVDFERRRRSLESADLVAALARWRDGTAKQALIARTLALRRIAPELFSEGDYRPVVIQGPGAGDLLAFERRHDRDAILVVVPRLPTSFMSDRTAPCLDAAQLEQLALSLPHDGPWHDGPWHDVLRGGTARDLRPAALLEALPVALLSTRAV
ncbi:MAG: malto-oligosyltrehalose synthase [Enhydrobacter sp.]|nr:MAG: malto-oligosyltrehalose synthase [Enhydrobacter sp.]